MDIAFSEVLIDQLLGLIGDMLAIRVEENGKEDRKFNEFSRRATSLRHYFVFLAGEPTASARPISKEINKALDHRVAATKAIVRKRKPATKKAVRKRRPK